LYLTIFFNKPTDYEAMSSVGITDPPSYISRMQLGKELITLTTCAVGPKILDDISAAIEEAIASGTWIDIMVCFSLSTFLKQILKILNA